MRRGGVGLGEAASPHRRRRRGMPGEPVPVPVVEGLRAYLPGGGDAAARRAAAGALDAACRGHGFASALGLVDAGLAERAFAAAEALFAAPGNAARLRRWNPSDNMGFSPMASEALDASGGLDLKESFNVRCPPSVRERLRRLPGGVSRRRARAVGGAGGGRARARDVRCGRPRA